MTDAEEARELLGCARCGRWSGPEILCVDCDRRETHFEHVREVAAAATRALGPDIMPAWVANKPHCRWVWHNAEANPVYAGWRRDIETCPMSAACRRLYANTARSWYGREMQARMREPRNQRRGNNA